MLLYLEERGAVCFFREKDVYLHHRTRECADYQASQTAKAVKDILLHEKL